MIRIPSTTAPSQRNAFGWTVVAAVVFLAAIIYSGCRYVAFARALPISQGAMNRLADSLQRHDWQTASAIADDPAVTFSGVREYRKMVATYGPVRSWRRSQDDAQYYPTGFSGDAQQRYVVEMARGDVTVLMSSTPGNSEHSKVRFLGVLAPNQAMGVVHQFSVRL